MGHLSGWTRQGGVLALLPCSRTGRMLRAPKRLRPCWTDFFDHSPWLLTSIVPLAFTGHGSNIFNKPNIYREGGPVEKRTFPFYPRSSLPIITTSIIVFPLDSAWHLPDDTRILPHLTSCLRYPIGYVHGVQRSGILSRYISERDQEIGSATRKSLMNQTNKRGGFGRVLLSVVEGGWVQANLLEDR